jgi:hypothetical protein
MPVLRILSFTSTHYIFPSLPASVVRDVTAADVAGELRNLLDACGGDCEYQVSFFLFLKMFVQHMTMYFSGDFIFLYTISICYLES